MMRLPALVLLTVVGLAARPHPAACQIAVEAVIAQRVEDRQPLATGDVFPADVEDLYCWTRITGAPEEGTTLHHVWIHGDEELLDVELRIGASSWRTWSNKNIPPDLTGEWRVEIRDPEGTVLETVRFRVGESGREDGAPDAGKRHT